MTTIPSKTIEIGIEDNLESIFENLKQATLMHKKGFQVKIDFSKIRAKGDIISSSEQKSEGVISFLKIYDKALSLIHSNKEKEPNHAILNVNHPDILEFLSYTSSFDIKVRVNNTFINAAQNNLMYDLLDPRTKKTVNQLNAKNVYNLIGDKTLNQNESGLLYANQQIPFIENKRNFEEIIPPPIVTIAS